MKLRTRQIDVLSTEIITTLTRNGDVEVTNRAEAELDVSSILKEYIRLDSELTEKAKDIMEIRKLPYDSFGRIKRSLAEQMDFGLGEESMNWICNQLIETFIQSNHIDEIFAEDEVLHRKVKEILRRYMSIDQDIDQEAKRRIKNLEEGTTAWEIEYERALSVIKRKHGIEK